MKELTQFVLNEMKFLTINVYPQYCDHLCERSSNVRTDEIAETNK